MKTSYKFKKAHIAILEPTQSHEYKSNAACPRSLETVQASLNSTLKKKQPDLQFTEATITKGLPYFATPSRTIELTYLTQYDDNSSERVGRKRMKVIIHEEIMGVINFESNAISHEIIQSLEDSLYEIYFPKREFPKTEVSYSL